MDFVVIKKYIIMQVLSIKYLISVGGIDAYVKKLFRRIFFYSQSFKTKLFKIFLKNIILKRDNFFFRFFILIQLLIKKVLINGFDEF